MNENERHYIQFPKGNHEELGQDEAFFYLIQGDEKIKLRLHDYDEIYKIPGLYEQLFYERLQSNSPAKVSEILKKTLDQSSDNLSEKRVLDFGAGNGIMGEELKKYGVSRLIGVDILQEAKDAVMRDRPGIYDAFYVADFCSLTDKKREEIGSWSIDCLSTVAALGFGDIPPIAFIEAVNLIQTPGWVAFNIKEKFLARSDDTGFSKTIRELIFSEFLDMYHIERYCHRLSLDGEPLFYFAIAARKNADIPYDFLDSIG